MKTRKNLSYDERLSIEKYLKERKSFKEIGRLLNRDCNCIRNEIKRHLIETKTVSKHRFFNNCIYRNNCKHSTRYQSCDETHHCSQYKKAHCDFLDKPPYCCNGCKDFVKCRISKLEYSADTAHKLYISNLSNSRKGITYTENELKRGNVVMTLSSDQIKKIELTLDDGRLDCARDASGVYSCAEIRPIKSITGICVDDQTNVGLTGNGGVPEDDSGFSYNRWYRNDSQLISSVAMTSNGVAFFQQGSLVLGYQRNVSINNGILYEGEQVIAEIVDSDNIKFYYYDEYGNVLGSAIYTRDTTQNGNISNYFIIDVAGYIKYAWINNNNMTWQDFINSDSKYNSLMYNDITRNAFYVVNGYVALDLDGISYIYYNGNKVSLSDTINNGKIYSIYSGSFEGYCSIDGEGLVFTPLGLTWKQWIESSHNGMYGLTLELDASGYVLYNGKRISTDATGTNLVTCDALMIDGQNYYSVS